MKSTLNVSLLTVEDSFPEEIYLQIHDDLLEWLFIRRGIVQLQDAAATDTRWVTNLEDWRRVVPRLAARNDLVFCTVDLGIPERPGTRPEARHGLTIVHEIQMRQQDGLRCCILTGLGGSELKDLNVPDVLFDFKGDTAKGFPNIVSYIKSQALSLIRTLEFPAPGGGARTIVLDEASGRLRDHFLSKAPYYVDAATWHVPILLLGMPGTGRRILLEFIAYLAGAEFECLDLGTGSAEGQHANFQRLERLCADIEGGRPVARTLLYLANLDFCTADPSAVENCLEPLRQILQQINGLSTEARHAFPVNLAFSASGDSRLRMPSRDSRGFVRFLEDVIGDLAGFPIRHLAMDQNGWSVDHPRILRVPSLRERGPMFVSSVIDARLRHYGASLPDDVKATGNPITLAGDVRDLLADKTDWALHRNLTGLVGELDAAFTAFGAARAGNQFEITRAHLSPDASRRLQRAVLNLDDVTLAFPTQHGEPLAVVERADFKVEEGELLVILGPSGCGKSTLLRMLAGLLMPTSGLVSYRGEPIRKPSEKRGVIFQDYSLFPWLTVRQNIEFGPRLRGVSPASIVSKVDHLIVVAKLKGFEDVYPHQLSGGMRQRVAIVRSIANDSDVLLMDEPFGALDVQTRWQMQDFLIETKRETSRTFVFVTHDLDEAVYLADRIYIASPRPLKLGDPIVVPFASTNRNTALRRDPVFVALVNRVRDSLLAAASLSSRGRTRSPTLEP